MALGKRLINTGGVAVCNTETTDIFGDSSGVALYSLDYDSSEASGNFNGEPYNGVNFGVSGKINTGARFNGTDQFIELGTNIFKYTDATISAWINPNVSNTSVKTIYGNTSYVNGQQFHGIIISVRNDGSSDKIFVQHYPSSTAVYSTGSISLNTFTHIAVSYTGSQTKIYINGSLDSTHSATLSYSASQTLTASLGAYILQDYTTNTTYDEFSGTIDQVRVFSKTLNPTEVGTLYAETACVHTATTTDSEYPVTNAAYYKLNNSAEDSKGTADGTEAGGVEYRFGRFGQAAVFNGSSSKLDLPSILPANSTADSSFTCWFNTSDTSGSQQTIVNAWNGSTTANNGGWALFKDAGNVLRLGHNYLTSGSAGTDGSTNVGDGNWHFVAVVFDYSAGTLKLFLDGNSTPEVQLTSLTPNTPNIFSGSNLSLGYQNPGGPFRYWNGKIDQVRIFSTALSSSQITQLYNEKPETDTSNFKTVLYGGNGGTQYISNVGFDLDVNDGGDGGLVWIKGRTVGASHSLQDTVNGEGQSKNLYPDNTGYLGQFGQFGFLSTFEANGFFVNAGSGNHTNANNKDYVAWTWKGGGDAVNIGVNSITGSTPSIASDVSANTEAGFSIVNWSGSISSSAETVGHGLSSAPELVILKNTDVSDNWYVFVNGVTSTSQNLKLNTDDDVASSSTMWGAGMTSTVAGIRPGSFVSSTSNKVIMYCWHSVAKYSSIGTYTGNGNSTGTTVTLDFAPSFVMIKGTDQTSNWIIIDNKRDTTNPNSGRLDADSSGQEYTGETIMDLNSDGFQLKTSSASKNGLDKVFIYMAFK